MLNLDEEFWSCEKLTLSEEYRDCYIENINLGKNICEKSKVVIISLARNCEKNLQKSIDQIIKLKSQDFQFFIYENNSIDNTKDILIESAKKKSSITISLNTDDTPYLTDDSRERTINLAGYRNTCLEWVKNNCANFNYTIVLDLDADLGFSVNGIYNSISWLNKIPKSSGMGSYSLYLNNKNFFHYDSFAFRLRDWNESTKNRQREKCFHQFHPKIGFPPVELNSCFGGLSVYKTEIFVNGKYDGSIGCEHVLFHKSLKKNGYNMYLNPSSIFFAVMKNSI